MPLHGTKGTALAGVHDLYLDTAVLPEVTQDIVEVPEAMDITVLELRQDAQDITAVLAAAHGVTNLLPDLPQEVVATVGPGPVLREVAVIALPPPEVQGAPEASVVLVPEVREVLVDQAEVVDVLLVEGAHLAEEAAVAETKSKFQ